MTLTSYTQSAAFKWANQCVETGSDGSVWRTETASWIQVKSRRSLVLFFLVSVCDSCSVMLLNHCYSSDCWQLSGLLPDGGGQKSTKQSPASTLVTILIVFIWHYSVLFVAIPSMGWRDVPGANPLFLKVFKFVGFLTPKLTLYLQISWTSFYCLLSPTVFISRFMVLHLSRREQVMPHSQLQTIKYDCRFSRLYTLSKLSITSKIPDSSDSNVHLQLLLFTQIIIIIVITIIIIIIIIIMIGALGAVSKDTETWLPEIGVKCCLESLQKACLLGTAILGH